MECCVVVFAHIKGETQRPLNQKAGAEDVNLPSPVAPAAAAGAFSRVLLESYVGGLSCLAGGKLRLRTFGHLFLRGAGSQGNVPP